MEQDKNTDDQVRVPLPYRSSHIQLVELNSEDSEAEFKRISAALRTEANLARQQEISREIKAKKAFRAAQRVRAKEEFDRKFRPPGNKRETHSMPAQKPVIERITVPKTITVWWDNQSEEFCYDFNGTFDNHRSMAKFKPRPWALKEDLDDKSLVLFTTPNRCK